jgi:hypothetical protein
MEYIITIFFALALIALWPTTNKKANITQKEILTKINRCS